jgi:hypothetical protein
MSVAREEELNMVNGGSIGETYEDGELLAGYGYIEKIGFLDLLLDWEDCSAKIDWGWRRAAHVTSVTKPVGANQYFIGKKEITREQALKMLG